jgi:hypothetical protein
MGYRLRWVIPNRVCEATIRIVDPRDRLTLNHSDPLDGHRRPWAMDSCALPAKSFMLTAYFR